MNNNEIVDGWRALTQEQKRELLIIALTDPDMEEVENK